jgi:threonine dehydratase
VAIADFFNAPDIIELNLTEYSGGPGQQIKMKVTDDFKVKAVMVTIQNENGSIVEEGSAIQIANTAEWVYTTKATNDTLSGDKITIVASDNPDNLTTREAPLE